LLKQARHPKRRPHPQQAEPLQAAKALVPLQVQPISAPSLAKLQVVLQALIPQQVANQPLAVKQAVPLQVPIQQQVEASRVVQCPLQAAEAAELPPIPTLHQQPQVGKTRQLQGRSTSLSNFTQIPKRLVF
jgi:hypothetical protein